MSDAGKKGRKEDTEGWRRVEGGNKLKEMMSQHASGVGRLLGGFEGRITKGYRGFGDVQ